MNEPTGNREMRKQYNEALKIINQQAEKIKELEAQNKWVKVSDRLPEKTDEYLLYCFALEDVIFEGYLADSKKFVDGEGYEEKHITHWMPPPDPPKGE